MQCPPLECDEKIAFRPDKKACCRQCPATTPRSNAAATAISDAVRLPRDQALPSTRRTAEEILSSGGCKYPFGGPYENGMEWHPRVHSHGEMKCVKCRCKVSGLAEIPRDSASLVLLLFLLYYVIYFKVLLAYGKSQSSLIYIYSRK